MTERLPKTAMRGPAWPRPSGWLRRHHVARWEIVVAGAAVTAAAVALSVTLRADFLAHPGWLAVQKADAILGPIAVGLYWRRRRPDSRFGPLLVAFGFVFAVYTLQSLSAPWLFSTGVLWEAAIYMSTVALILAFPNGRLDGRLERLILATATVTAVAPFVGVVLFSRQISGEGSISGCRTTCPSNALLISPEPSLTRWLLDVERVAIITIAVALIGLLVWRLATGTPPRRRALAIGAPVSLLFLLTQAGYQATKLLDANPGGLYTFIRWTFVGTRAAIWYGFFLALVAAELFAGRVLREVVAGALRRPSLRELEAILRRPLGDPTLRLAFWQPRTQTWADVEGAPLALPEPSSGQTLTKVERHGGPAAAIVHDPQLGDDPELLQAALATALLALENAELEAGWNESLRELRFSRARIAAARDVERHKLERDLHDGAQQRLVGLLVRLAMIGELADNPALRRGIGELEVELEEAIEELRELAHGIYPPLLAEMGLAAALRSVSIHTGGTLKVTGSDVGRYSTEIESAVYYCCLEALQNATKHAGAGAQISIRLKDNSDQLEFEVRDDGPGFEMAATHDGAGLQNMQDRVGALDGRLEVTSGPGRGTVISGAVPLGRADRAGVPNRAEQGRAERLLADDSRE